MKIPHQGFRRSVLPLRRSGSALGDVVAGVLEGDEPAAAGQVDRVIESPLAAAIGLHAATS
jgi:hypothetical protein